MNIIDAHNNDVIDYNKILNCKCYCSIGLCWNGDETVMAYPCEHMYHNRCFDKLDNKICKICNTEIKKKLTMFDKDLHHQRFADILSMSYYDNMSNNTPVNFLDSIFDFASVMLSLPFLKSHEDGKLLCEKIFSMNNLTLKVHGLEKVKKIKNKVYICNHTSHYELIILYYLLKPGFLSSSIINDVGIAGYLKNVVNLFTFSRNDTNRSYNIVDEMRKFVDKYGSICIFPEGLMKHPDSLVRFRSGAFHINRPIFAIVIRHNDILSDYVINKLLYKLGAKRDINIEVYILGPYYPPFSDKDIEQIRIDMAKYGNMVLSRVSNRDIKDE